MVKSITAVIGIVAMLGVPPAFAQSKQYQDSPTVTASSIGHWLYDPQGNITGSVRDLADDGRTAVIMVGVYFQPGSHEARIPAGALSMVNGKVTLRAETVQAINAPAGR